MASATAAGRPGATATFTSCRIGSRTLALSSSVKASPAVVRTSRMPPRGGKIADREGTVAKLFDARSGKRFAVQSEAHVGSGSGSAVAGRHAQQRVDPLHRPDAAGPRAQGDDASVGVFFFVVDAAYHAGAGVQAGERGGVHWRPSVDHYRHPLGPGAGNRQQPQLVAQGGGRSFRRQGCQALLDEQRVFARCEQTDVVRAAPDDFPAITGEAVEIGPQSRHGALEVGGIRGMGRAVQEQQMIVRAAVRRRFRRGEPQPQQRTDQQRQQIGQQMAE